MSINAACEEDLKKWCSKNSIRFDRSPECSWPDYLSYASLSPKLRKRYNVKSKSKFNKNHCIFNNLITYNKVKKLNLVKFNPINIL